MELPEMVRLALARLTVGIIENDQAGAYMAIRELGLDQFQVFRGDAAKILQAVTLLLKDGATASSDACRLYQGSETTAQPIGSTMDHDPVGEDPSNLNGCSSLC